MRYITVQRFSRKECRRPDSVHVRFPKRILVATRAAARSAHSSGFSLRARRQLSIGNCCQHQRSYQRSGKHSMQCWVQLPTPCIVSATLINSRTKWRSIQVARANQPLRLSGRQVSVVKACEVRSLGNTLQPGQVFSVGRVHGLLYAQHLQQDARYWTVVVWCRL